MKDLHAALKSTIVQEVDASGFRIKHVRLQYAKDDFLDTLHVQPSSYSTAGLQGTDLLSFIGFRRSPCAFHRGECYVSVIPQEFDPLAFAKSAAAALSQLEEAENHLERCGLTLPHPEGWGFFFGKPSEGRRYSSEYTSGNGHVAPKVQRLKASGDEYFNFVLTWIEGAGAKGWTTHYRATHMPLSAEFAAALEFIGGFASFTECPEFDFESCWWRFTSYKEDDAGVFGRHTDYVHRSFDAHAAHFSPGLKALLSAHVELEKHGFSFLKIGTSAAPADQPYGSSPKRPQLSPARPIDLDAFDVAISFAGTEREYAKQLAELLRTSGFKVFYDNFYPEQLWGKDLVAFFDRVYRKASKYCVMFVSAEYANRMWTTHERRSAQARALEEKGREYILPIRVDQTDLEGLPPTIGYLSLDQYSVEQIAQLLVKKLKGEGR
jgi:hypothetical protein